MNFKFLPKTNLTNPRSFSNVQKTIAFGVHYSSSIIKCSSGSGIKVAKSTVSIERSEDRRQT